MENQRIYKNLLLHVPHSSTHFPDFSNYSFEKLDNDEKQLIDYFTDEIFIPKEKSEHIKHVVFPYCRLFCDVERLAHDPLEKMGMGIVYNRDLVKSGGRFYSPIPERREALKHYIDYHAMVSNLILDMGDKTLLIDCHSFSSIPTLLNPTTSDVDICIGFNDDETCPDKAVISNVVHHFESLGYKVGINQPFSNSKTFNAPLEYHSIMIEVNKKHYMNEQTIEKSDDFVKLSKDIQSLYKMLIS